MITKNERRQYWIDLDTGEIMTYWRMCIILVNDYDFEVNITPESEIYEFFAPTGEYMETPEEIEAWKADRLEWIKG